MTRVAAVDCGTNTIKLLIVDQGPDGGMRDLVRELRMVRLGEGVDRTGRLAPGALERTFGAVEEYAGLIEEYGAQRVRFVATSATRDAANADEFARGVRERLGVDPEVVTGVEEARLAYGGAVRNLDPAAPRPVGVIDIGGGSTELILGGEDGEPTAYSMDIGSVRLTERLLASDPPTPDQIAACAELVDAQLDDCPVDIAEAVTVVGVAGTITQLAAGMLDLRSYDPAAVDQAVLDFDGLAALEQRLRSMTVAQRRDLPWMHPERADVIVAGAVILERVLARSGASSLVVSESDILDGIAWSLTD